MKSILIPTVLENDTLFAVDMAIQHAKGKNCGIVLLMLTEAPDACSGAEFLRRGRKPLTSAQCEVLEECRDKVNASGNCTLDIHYQYGISAAILRNLLDYLVTDIIILSPSYKAERKRIHMELCKLMGTCKKPILHLENTTDCREFTKALYIERNDTQMDIRELQQLVNTQFGFKIVSQATIANEQNPEEMPFLIETISRNNIDLLVETRKPKTKLGKIPKSETFGLPVLSIHEEAVKL